MQEIPFISPLLQLFFPHICHGCGSDLLEENHLLCLKCINDLPHTDFAKFAGNPTERIFHGRLPVLAASSEYYFTKGSLMQSLIHQLKYRNNHPIGMYLGKRMGASLLAANRFGGIEAIVPLPLSPDKEFKRGYNQSVIISKGIAESMRLPVYAAALVRKRASSSQTKKHRAERWENVAGNFELREPSLLKNRHILLVDDVITTGATLEACGSALLQGEGTRLSLATLAFASH